MVRPSNNARGNDKSGDNCILRTWRGANKQGSPQIARETPNEAELARRRRGGREKGRRGETSCRHFSLSPVLPFSPPPSSARRTPVACGEKNAMLPPLSLKTQQRRPARNRHAHLDGVSGILWPVSRPLSPGPFYPFRAPSSR